MGFSIAVPRPSLSVSKILDAFKPHRAISREVMTTIVIIQGAFALLFWTYGPSALIPRPLEVWESFKLLWNEFGMSREMWGSMVTNAQALALTTVASLLVSYATALKWFKPLAVVISKCRFLGITGLVFLFTVEIGGGHTLKLALLMFGIGAYFVTSMCSVLASIHTSEYDHARTLRMSEWRVVWEVDIIGTADQAIEVLRQCAAIGWMMLTMVEGKTKGLGGLGAMLLNQDKHLGLSKVFAIQASIFMIGIAIDYGIGVFKNLVCPYAKLDTEGR